MDHNSIHCEYCKPAVDASKQAVTYSYERVQAVYSNSQIPALDEWNSRRATAAAFYRRELSGLPWLTLPHVPKWAQPCWHLFVVRCSQRDALMAHLAASGVQAIVHYPIPPHLSGAYADLGLPAGSFPLTEELSGSVLSLPIGPHMTAEQLRRVVDAVKSFDYDVACAAAAMAGLKC